MCVKHTHTHSETHTIACAQLGFWAKSFVYFLSDIPSIRKVEAGARAKERQSSPRVSVRRIFDWIINFIYFSTILFHLFWFGQTFICTFVRVVRHKMPFCDAIGWFPQNNIQFWTFVLLEIVHGSMHNETKWSVRKWMCVPLWCVKQTHTFTNKMCARVP